jgi:arsenite-transporting ATPase
LNGVFEAQNQADPVAAQMQTLAEQAVAEMPSGIAALDRTTIPLKPTQVIGVEALRAFFAPNAKVTTSKILPAASSTLPGLESLVDGLQLNGRGVIMTMGKGGVGKTTIAARIAAELARRGYKVHLTTTDPAAHIAGAIADIPDNLTIGEINPAVEVARYRAEVIATMGAKLDANGRALLEEDLSSPCTEEVAVFQAFARTVSRAVDSIVVIDTAPTGHTILLLDAAQSFHREVMRQSKSVTDSVRNLLPRLRDPAFTRIILCTLAEATPVHEAAALQADLRRAAIEPYAWIINQSLAPLELSEPLLVARRSQESGYIDEVMGRHAHKTFLVAWEAAIASQVPNASPRVFEPA